MLRIGYGLIGLGGIARTHLQVLKSMSVLDIPAPPTELVGLFTTDPNKVEQGHKIGFKHVVHDLDELLVLDVDVVDICTPNYLHYPQILAAAQHGKHVYYEKPLCLDEEEAEALGRELEDYSGTIQGAYVLRFLPVVAKARGILKDGVIGQVHSFRFTSYHSSYLNPNRPGAWRLQHAASGGGVLMDLGSHMLDLVRFMLGEPTSVKAWTNTFVKKRFWPNGEEMDVDVDDHTLVVLGLEGGGQGTVEVSRVAVGNDGMTLEFYGEKGAIHVDPAQGTCRCFNAWGQEIFPKTEQDPFLHNLLAVFPPAKLSLGWMVDIHLASLAWFLRTVASGEILEGTPDLKEGILTQKLVNRAYASVE